MVDHAGEDASSRQEAEAWLTGFLASNQYGRLTATQRRHASYVIGCFVEAMRLELGRAPGRWHAAGVERCCLEILPESGVLKASQLWAMPVILVAFLDFLGDAGQIANATSLIRALHRAQERMGRQLNAGVTRSRDADEQQHFGPESEDSLIGLRRFASRIAREIVKERPALISREEMEQFERQPILIFDLLQLLIDEFAHAAVPNDAMVTACFMLLSHALRNIRLGIERHFEWALELDREFQSLVVRRVGEEQLSPQFLAGILESLAEARLDPSRALLESYEQQIMHHAPREALPSRGQIDAMFENLVDEHAGDPFAVGETLAQMTRALPSEAQSALIGEFAASTLPGMKDAVVILALHPEEPVRREALRWLLENARFVTSTALRRLIVIRNWLPEGEKRILDALIKEARIKGVECARWDPPLPLEGLQASRMDGVGALSLLLSMPVKPNRARIAGILLKQRVGIADSWITPPIPRNEAKTTFRQVARQELFLDVTRAFLDVAIRHHLAVGLAEGMPAPAGLLQMAEALVVENWVPERLDGRALLERLLGTEESAIPSASEPFSGDPGVQRDMEQITGSWFEESQEVMDFLESTRVRGRERLTRRVLDLFCEPNREMWAERCAWTAYWLREQSVKVKRMVGMDRHFAWIAQELYRGRPLHELILMRRVAERTLGDGT
ncbi:MAG: hypothetical protein HQL86_06435 [Magnetococcales bacterium]|nr:hypothetical protein [Magnetococcales bacterium]